MLMIATLNDVSRVALKIMAAPKHPEARAEVLEVKIGNVLKKKAIPRGGGR
jgi:hypothetical protein